MGSIDQSVLDGIIELSGDGSNGFLLTLIQLYVDSAPAKVQKIKKAFAQNDGKTASFEAHDLKSSSASLGAVSVSRLAAEIEKATKDGNVPAALVDQFTAFENEFSLALKELQEHLDAATSSMKKAA